MSTEAAPYEDLTTDDAPVEAAPTTAPAGSVKSQWQRWVTHPDTKERTLETYDLRSYERSIEDLWHRLCELDVPLPVGVISQNLDAFGGPAVKLLYLLSHQPHEYRHLRSQPDLFIEAIEDWADLNVPREKTSEAVILALAIHNRVHAAATPAV